MLLTALQDYFCICKEESQNSPYLKSGESFLFKFVYGALEFLEKAGYFFFFLWVMLIFSEGCMQNHEPGTDLRIGITVLYYVY